MRSLAAVLVLSASTFVLLPASEASDDDHWYCDGNAANDPKPTGAPGNHAPASADRVAHTFGPGWGNPHYSRSTPTTTTVAYSADDAMNGACALSEVSTTDGDGELESGNNGAHFTVTDATNCGGYGNGHHGPVRDAGATNIAVPTFLSFTTGTDGPIHAVDDPTTPTIDERMFVLDPCLGNGIVASDPLTDAYDCTSNTGWAFFGVIVVASPAPVDPILSGGICDDVEDMQTVFLDTGPTAGNGFMPSAPNEGVVFLS